MKKMNVLLVINGRDYYWEMKCSLPVIKKRCNHFIKQHDNFMSIYVHDYTNSKIGKLLFYKIKEGRFIKVVDFNRNR